MIFAALGNIKIRLFVEGDFPIMGITFLYVPKHYFMIY